MLHKNLILLPNTSGKVNLEGEPVKAVGYYSKNTNKRINTITFYTKGFTGRIHLYGTLSLNPTEEDWAPIKLCDTTDYIEFDNYGKPKPMPENFYINVFGAYTFLKAKMDREYLHCIKTPVPFNYRPRFVLTSPHVMYDHSIPLRTKMVKVMPCPTPDLARCGNIECIRLTY